MSGSVAAKRLVGLWTMCNTESILNEQHADADEQIEGLWSGQQRFRYFVSAVILPFVAILLAYCDYKMPVRMGPWRELGYTVATLTSWSDSVYAIAMVVQLWTSAAMIKCCASSKMTVPKYVRTTAWTAVVLWVLIAGLLILKTGLISIWAAIVASTLLAAFVLICAALIPPGVTPELLMPSRGRFTILKTLLLTTVVAVVAAIMLGLPGMATESFGMGVARQLLVGLFALFLLACPILAIYAYARAAIDFRSGSSSASSSRGL